MSRLQDVLKLVGLPAIATAFALFLGVQVVTARYAHFGIDPTVLGLSWQDYLISGISGLFFPVAALAVMAIVTLLFYWAARGNSPTPPPAARKPLLINLMVSAILVVLLLAATAVWYPYFGPYLSREHLAVIAPIAAAVISSCIVAVVVGVTRRNSGRWALSRAMAWTMVAVGVPVLAVGVIFTYLPISNASLTRVAGPVLAPAALVALIYGISTLTECGVSDAQSVIRSWFPGDRDTEEGTAGAEGTPTSAGAEHSRDSSKRQTSDRVTAAGGRTVTPQLLLLCLLTILLTMHIVASMSALSAVVGEVQGAQLAHHLVLQPGVIVHSKQPLPLLDHPRPTQYPKEDTPEPKMSRLPASPYPYRYLGLRLLIRSNGVYFLLPQDWNAEPDPSLVGGQSPVIELPDNNDIRVEFTRGS